MLKNDIRSGAQLWFLVALAAATNGCAMSTYEDGQVGETDEAVSKPPNPVSSTQPPPPPAPAVQHHHICYEGNPLLNQNGTVARLNIHLRCRASDGGCGINNGGLTTAGENWVTIQSTVPSSPITQSATFQFADGSTQSCTYTVGGYRATAGAVLDGYTTDASGLVTTGVWRRHSTASQHDVFPDGQVRTWQSVAPTGDFVTVGGGAVGIPDAAFVVSSYSSSGWFGATESNNVPVDHDNDVYAIGMRVEGLSTSLGSLIQTRYGSSSPNIVAHPTSQVDLPASSVALGGGGYGYTPPPDGVMNPWLQYFTASKPVMTASNWGNCQFTVCYRSQVTAWIISTKDQWVPGGGWTNSKLYYLPTDVTVNGAAFHFAGMVTSGVSAVAAQPSTAVTGAPGEYALTGVGAYVNWETDPTYAGNLVWKIQPRADIAGVDVASSEHGAPSPAAITGYAVGIKLVPGHS